MKRYIKVMTLALALSMALQVTCFASRQSHDREDILKPQTPTDRTMLNVRVNGYEVDFPDAQPFVDENGRTMIPLRFATEALGAQVGWDAKTRTASITKNDVTAKVAIGSDVVTVVKNGASSQVTMDTTAVLKDGRTYVPIRYVAEALGAYVDYSSIYKTVGIYQGLLSAEEITKLHSYQRFGSVEKTGEYEKLILAEKQIDLEDFCYHTEFQDSFASARELCYDAWNDSLPGNVRKFPTLGIDVPEDDEECYMASLVKEAKAYLDFEGQNYKVEFRTDPSSIYSPPDDGWFWSVRGYLHVTQTKSYDDLSSAEKKHASKIRALFQNADVRDATSGNVLAQYGNTDKNDPTQITGYSYNILSGSKGYTMTAPVDIQISDHPSYALSVCYGIILDRYSRTGLPVA